MQNRRSVLIAASALACAPVNARAAQEAAAAPTSGQRPRDRAEAVAIIANLRRIVADDGIETVTPISIGGIEQYVSIRSRDRRNPVLIVVHGGPGWVAMPTSWWFAHGWEEYFTVVQWDQRGAGKTYVVNDPEALAATMTQERMQSDLEEVVQWARARFAQDKVFVLGHSWGSILGLALAHERPEWLHAYVGVGQAVDAMESERRGYRWTLARAQAAHNREALCDLRAIAPYAEQTAPSYQQVLVQRRWLNFYGGAAYNRPNAGFEADAVALAPEYTDEDLRRVWEANDFSAARLFPAVLATNLGHITQLRTPLLLFLGRHDANVSSSVAAEWFETVSAPSKQLIWFEQSAHEIMVEEPGKVLISLVTGVLPLSRARAR